MRPLQNGMHVLAVRFAFQYEAVRLRILYRELGDRRSSLARESFREPHPVVFEVLEPHDPAVGGEVTHKELVRPTGSLSHDGRTRIKDIADQALPAEIVGGQRWPRDSVQRELARSRYRRTALSAVTRYRSEGLTFACEISRGHLAAKRELQDEKRV